MAKIFSLTALGKVISSIIVCRPHWLSENEFLKGFVNHEVIALMTVILTVTLASVANIHIALNKIVTRRFSGNAQLIKSANEVKKEITDNAWYIFWGFALTIIVLLVKGLNTNDELIVAIANGIVIWTFSLFIFCMYDIYKVTFGIIDLEMELEEGAIDAHKNSAENTSKNRE